MSFAQEMPLIEREPSRTSLLSNDRLKVSARVGVEWFLKKGAQGQSGYRDTLRSNRTDLNLDYLIMKGLLARVVLRLDQWYREDGANEVSTLKAEDLLHQVSLVAMHDEGSWALGIKGIELGKLSEVTFGQNRSREHRPVYNNNSVLNELTRLDQAMGIIMTLDTSLVNDVIRDVAITLYDSQREGFQFERVDAFAARAVQRFFENQLQVTASYLFQGNREKHQSNEQRGSIGFIYDLGGGEVWAEVVWLDGAHGNLNRTDRGFTVGASNKNLLSMAELGAEVNYVENQQSELVGWAKFKVKPQVTVGPEIGYLWEDASVDAKDGFYFGLRGEWLMGPAYSDDPALFDVFGSNRIKD